MTDAAYNAKNWLMRVDELEEKRKKQINKVMLIEAKLNNCVSHFDLSGSRDPISARAAHEDLLADYITARDELEHITNLVIHEDYITIRVVERLNNACYAALLFDIHLNRHSITAIVKSNRYEVKRTQLYNYYLKALQELAEILENNPPELKENQAEILKA